MSIFSGINNLTQEKEREEYISKLSKARKAKYSNPEEGEPIQTERGILDKTLGLLGYTGVVEGIYNMMDDDEESTFFSGLKEGFQYMNPRNEDVTGRHFMSDVLEKAGWIDNPDSKLDNVARGAVGLLGDIVLDPLSFINPYGSAAKVVKGSGVALDAAKEAKRITNQAKTSDALKLLREGRYEDPNHIVGITHDEARNIITENYNKLGVTLTDDVLEAETNTLVKTVNKQGLKKAEGGKDFTLGLDNYPFMDKINVGDKKLSDFRVNLIAADRLRAIGDDSIAPYFNSLTRRMRYSNLYKTFNKNADWEKGLAKDFRGTTDQIYGWSLVDSLGNKGLKKLMLSLSEGQDLETAFQSLDEDIQKNFTTLYENGTLKMAAKFLEQKGKIIERLMENEGKILKNIDEETERITNHINENRTRHAALSEEIKSVRKAKETAAKKIKNEFEDKYKDVTVHKVTEESLQKELDDLNIEHSQLTEFVTKMGTGSFHGDLYTELAGIKSSVKVINMVMDLAAAQHHNNKWLANYKAAADTRVSGLDFDWIARRGGKVDYSEVGNFNLKSNRHYLNEFDLNAQDYATVKLSEEGGGIGESISSSSNKVDAEVIEKHLNKASGIKSDADGRLYIEQINPLDKEKFVDWINVEFHNGRPKINYDISDNVLRDAQAKFLELKNASSKVEEEKVKRTLLDMFRPFIAREAYDKTFYEFVAKPLNEGAFSPSFMQTKYTTPRYIAPSMLVDGFSGRLFLGVNEFGKPMKIKFNLVPEIAGALKRAYLNGDKFINVPEVGLHSVESVKNTLYQCAVELGFNSVKGAEDGMFLKYLQDINPKFYRDYYEQLMASAFNSSDELRDIFGNDFLSRMGKATDIEEYVFKGYSSMIDEATNFEIPLRNFQSANTFKIKPFKYLLFDRAENFKTKGVVNIQRPEKKLNSVVSGTPALDSAPDGLFDIRNASMSYDSKSNVVKELVPEKLEVAAKKSTQYKFKELKDNMWKYIDEADVIAFTSNGIVKNNGFAVMGAGAAKEARHLLPNIGLKLGRGIRAHGNVPMFLDTKGKTQIWNFPTKLYYKDDSSLELIEQSAKLLREQADKNGWKNIVVNSPGTGLGGLNYNDVAKILDKHFDERFIIARDVFSSKSTPSVKKTLEVSSKGDRRFSALYAKIERNGKKISIEDVYQGAKRLEDGSKPSKAKGFKPHHFEVDGKMLTLDEGSEWYKSLWKEYLDKNPDLVEVLKEYDYYVDSMAGKNVWNSQADAIKEYMDNIKKPLNRENNSAIKPLTKLDIEKGIKSGKLKANAQYLPNSHAVDYSTLNKVDQILVDKHSMLIDDPIRIGMFGKGVAPVIDLINSSESTIIAKSLRNEVLVNARLQRAENKAISLFKELSIEKQIEALEKTNDAAIKALDEFADGIIFSTTRFEIDELLSTDLFPRQFRFPHEYADMAIDKMKHGDYSPEFLDIAREHLAKRYDLLKMKLVGEAERFKTNFAEDAFYKQLKKLDKEDRNKLIPPAETKAMAKDAISEIDAYYGRKTTDLVVSPETPLSTKYYTVEELDKELKKRLKAERETYNKRIRELQEELDTLEFLPDSETMAELLYTSEKAEQSLNRYAKYQAGKDYVSIDKNIAEEMGISYQFYKELDMLAKDDKTMAIYDMFSKKMREIAELEVKAGRLRPEQAEIMDGIYLPHILTDEAKDFINKSFVNPDSGKFNPKVLGLQHAYDKNRFFKSLDDVNRYLREGVGIDEEHIPEIVKTLRSNNVQQMFIDNVADIYIQRVIGSNKLLFGDEATDYFKYVCGTPYTGAREMDHVVIHHPQLRRFFSDTMKYIKKHPDAFGDKFTSPDTLAKYIGIDTRMVGPNTPFIPLEDFQIKLLNDIDFIVGGNSRKELFNMSDSVVSRVNVISRKQEQLLESQMLKLYDGFLNNWKLLNTVVHPGFHIQNAVSNAFQSFLGVGVDAFNVKRIKLSRQILESGDPKQVVKLGGKEYTHQQLRYIAMESRVLDNTFFNKDVTTKVYDFPLYSAGTKVGTTIEGTQRMNLFLSFIDRGMSPAEAVEGVNKFLFDYGALTDFEKKVMKRIIPFYSFMRKNIPLELEMFVEQPNTYKLIEKFFTNVEKQTEGEYIPENYRHEMRQEHITLPWTMEGDTYGISDQLPHNQLDRVFDLRKMLGQTSPVIKTPIEIMTGKYTYTDVPIDGAGDYLANQIFPSKLLNMAMKKEEGAERQAYIVGQLLGFPIQKINKNPEKVLGTMGASALTDVLTGVPINTVQAIKESTIDNTKNNTIESKGNIDLYNRPQIKNPDGSISTVYSMTFTDDDGKFILVPGVRDGLDRVMTEKEAWDYYKKTGEYLGKFDTLEEAEDYAEKLHQQQDAYYTNTSR